MEAMKTGIDLAKKNGDKSVVMQFKPDGKGGMEMVKHSSVPKTPVVKKPARKPAAKKVAKKVAVKKAAKK